MSAGTTGKRTVRIRAEWGTWLTYARLPEHNPAYCWDGEVSVNGGRVLRQWQLSFDGRFGPNRELWHRLRKPKWRSRVQFRNETLEGILFDIEGTAATRIILTAGPRRYRFSLGKLLRRKKLEYHIGPKYSCMKVTIRPDGYDELEVQREELDAKSKRDGRARILLEASDFSPATRRGIWFTARCAWVPEHGETRAAFKLAAAPLLEPLRRSCYKLTVKLMISPRSPDEEKEVREWMILALSINGREALRRRHLFTPMRGSQRLEEIVFDAPAGTLRAGNNELVIRHVSGTARLLVNRVIIEETIEEDLQVTCCPVWVEKDLPFELELLTLTEHRDFRVFPGHGISLLKHPGRVLPPGRHRVTLVATQPLCNAPVRFETQERAATAAVKHVLDLPREHHPMLVGVDLNLVTPENPGAIEWMFDHFKDTQLGNYFLMRSDSHPIPLADWERWARHCKRSGHSFSIEWYTAGKWPRALRIARRLKEIARENFLGILFHELSGVIYGGTGKEHAGRMTMQKAKENYLSHIRRRFGPARGKIPCVIGEAAPVVGYDYEAGADICQAEVLTGHSVLLMSSARGASRAYGKRLWGLHIAAGCNKSPQDDDNLRMWWLSLYLGYMYGASIAYDEEALLENIHSKKYSFSDKLCARRRDMLRQFFHFARSHPRKGEPEVPIAVLQGYLSCDSTGGLNERGLSPSTARPERIREVKVWGGCGADTPEWNHREPENGMKLLDEFLPGVWLQPLNQNIRKVRRWFSGTPHGQVDLIPAETPSRVLRQYKSIFVLGWNTMTTQLYEKLKQYVRAGGHLFMAVPHLSTHTSRTFLHDMGDLALFNKGDFRDLFGVHVLGRGPRATRAGLTASGKKALDPGAFDSSYPFASSGHRPHTAVHTAHLKNNGAKILIEDISTGAPLLTSIRLGKGSAYLLTTWNYPGSEGLERLARHIIRAVANRVTSPVRITDPTGEVNYAVYHDRRSDTRWIHAANTDWTRAANVKRCTLQVPGRSLPLSVKEGQLLTAACAAGIVIVPEGMSVHIETIEKRGRRFRVTVNGFGQPQLTMYNVGRKPVVVRWNGARISSRWNARQESLSLSCDLTTRSKGTLEVKLR